MGGKTDVIYLSEEEYSALQLAYRQSKDKRYARRCRIIILKSQHHGLTDVVIAELLGINVETAKVWRRRYKKEGLGALYTPPPKGRPPILNVLTHGEKVKKEVRKHRQRIKQSHETIEQAVGEKFSTRTLKRFLKSLTEPGDESGND
jgi:transposase